MVCMHVTFEQDAILVLPAREETHLTGLRTSHSSYGKFQSLENRPQSSSWGAGKWARTPLLSSYSLASFLLSLWPHTSPCFLPSPKLRISFITVGTDANTLMPLTSDSNKIQTGLRQLESTVPGGVPNIHKGFQKAREEIQRVYYQEDYNIISLVVALLAGKLSPTALQETKNEAKAARNHGAKIYLVGIKDYSKDQLDSIVERKNQVYGLKGYTSLQDIVFPVSVHLN
ncbi:anthrax toxin receptor-like isoform X1 [Manis pentadactyla]|uniref:anthrax toxin receptor-like isoform X1 n=1 Tax=Manis pentadactyla TaxID=143292 RepID=UPI00255C5879|nr:anthrax toxin receptor-like isoform X1 [Manis pentadactyla]